jgi:outer membrane protein TolC
VSATRDGFKRLIACLVVCILPAQVSAQQTAASVEKRGGPLLIRSYEGPTTPSVRLHNSDRIHSLIRGGKLYLTVQDAIALAIENNLDLEVDRYGPILADWALQRAQAGGTLRGVTSGSSTIASSTSGQGISGSQQAAGLSSGSGGGGGGGGNAVVSQIGPVTANLDPVLQNTTVFSHTTYPQSNVVQSQTAALVDTSHIYSTTLQEGLLTGGYVQLNQREQYLEESTPTDVLNPSVAPRVTGYVQHNFLSGFGTGVNSRFIRVAKSNVGISRETFRSQLLDLVASVLNLYWDLVADNDTVKANQNAVDIARKFYDDTKVEISLGVIAKVDIYRAQAEVATREQNLSVARVAVQQQETLLKNALSRNGMEDPALDAAAIVPLDQIQVPDQDNLPPLRDMLATAMAKRPDVSATNARLANSRISALGTANGILPQLVGFAQIYNSGLAGVPQVVDGATAGPYFSGGLGTALSQVFQRDFPSQRGGAYLQGTFRNRIAQGDYGVDQLQMRQTELTTRRDMNQIMVDISNQVVALRQARLRYSAAVDTRKLQEQLLEMERRKFSLGTSTFNNVIVVQRSLAAAQTNEVATLAAYSQARVGLDHTLGETLERNNVSVEAALNGTAK